MRLFTRRNNPDEDPLKLNYSYGSIDMSVGIKTNNYSGAKYGVESFGIDRWGSGSRVARFDVSTYGPFSNPNMLSFVLDGLPTSASNLSTGTV